MSGSGWPVPNAFADYAAMWLDAAETLTESLSAGPRDALFGGTATKF
jgi:predicted TIM-barrel fold metal-dependent hydrolase